jgi:hypothetical protein
VDYSGGMTVLNSATAGSTDVVYQGRSDLRGEEDRDGAGSKPGSPEDERVLMADLEERKLSHRAGRRR